MKIANSNASSNPSSLDRQAVLLIGKQPQSMRLNPTTPSFRGLKETLCTAERTARDAAIKKQFGNGYMFSGKNLLVPLCGNGQRWQAELHL